jgi:tRNA(Arg) A34 adenosine deaminase TadA
MLPHNHSASKRVLLRLAGAAILMFPAIWSRQGHAASIYLAAIDQPETSTDRSFIERAFEMRTQAIKIGDQAYGAIVVRDGIIVGQSASHVVVNQDPTAHAEMEAIRDAAHRLGSRDLSGCTLYSSSPACPMCEAAAYWADIDRMVSGESAYDGGYPSLCG